FADGKFQISKWEAVEDIGPPPKLKPVCRGWWYVPDRELILQFAEGDRLTYEIVEIGEGKMVLKHEFTDENEQKWLQVKILKKIESSAHNKDAFPYRMSVGCI